ncbi:uncharacterized protein BDZ99DRAFT_575747 [Mytilinidion resinicola]|uniref:Zn(2)-C6 fungal-type domain-containing protein n=1 Tax=Mytilinidion resinicola TaxID=574789 RepID=A0A6A6Y5P3_9PEZI|nr:uncharacterized protein BDZ99DRAFT_575747 [Mytilinidion resinicola]KAF2804112.1 hypothetical protein BDZ99DRAFT_575747 [Mytilinidion resinicola]
MAMSSSATRAVEPQKPESANTTAPRKRRRRAPATGAAEDCHACRKAQTKCDRKRPYCGPCIDLGKECSGYRTTLTWGVGVASRGKLRGLSTPVVQTPSQTSNARDSKTQTSSDKAASNRPTSKADAQRTLNMQRSQSPASPVSYPPPQEFMHLDATSPIPIPSPTTSHLGWHIPGYGDHLDYTSHSGKMSRPHLNRGPLQRLHTSLAVSYEDAGLSASTGSLSAYSDSDYPSPSEYPQTPEDFSFADNSIPPYHGLLMHEHTPMSSSENLLYQEAPRSYPVTDDMNSSISSDQSHHDYVEANAAPAGSYESSSYPDVFFEGEMGAGVHGFSHPGYAYLPAEGTSSNGSGVVSTQVSALTPSVPQNLYPFPASHLSQRMRYLLDYYDKFICPVLVAFDGPTNPYRMHVMHLAMRNEGLMNAIAALATNNIRMRGGIEAHRLGFKQDHGSSGLLPDHAYSKMTAEELRELHGEPSPEERVYKSTSIALLNAELADPIRAKDDSVLATLLILCLFHVCDSGFSKFKTQLAGVQKLLSLRDRSVQSNFVGWIEVFFTWFDVMNSTVNDRETQVLGDSLDMMNLSTDLGALEHFSGCEGRLFKLIARLGRLNLLSQNRPVRDLCPENSTTPTQTPQLKNSGKDYYSLQLENLDGNGWGASLGDAPSHASMSPRGSISVPEEDPRAAFWMEWHDVRSRLQEWELEPSDPQSCGATSSSLALSPAQAALLHISESFRYAALLYTERLAHPTVSSSALNIQNLVAQGLYHISQIGVTSCVNKFLLWPLFITGTECVDEQHRAIVRQRCVEIQRESGFFNNLSGLEVLERVWREDDERREGDGQSVEQGMLGAQAFKWRSAMDRVDGEYIMI